MARGKRRDIRPFWVEFRSQHAGIVGCCVEAQTNAGAMAIATIILGHQPISAREIEMAANPRLNIVSALRSHCRAPHACRMADPPGRGVRCSYVGGAFKHCAQRTPLIAVRAHDFDDIDEILF